MMQRWTLEGTADGAVYVFEVNPNRQDSPTFNRDITWLQTRAGFTGRRAPRAPLRWSFSGVLRSKEQYEAFLTWVTRKDRLMLTDDLGNVYSIKLVGFAPTSTAGARSRVAPYRQTYVMQALIFQEATP